MFVGLKKILSGNVCSLKEKRNGIFIGTVVFLSMKNNGPQVSFVSRLFYKRSVKR